MNFGMKQFSTFNNNKILSPYVLGIGNHTGDSGEVTQAVTTEWPWPWHPDIHWYHQYLNLSSVGPEIWHGLHVTMLMSHSIKNESHAAFKWTAQVLPNVTALNELYKKEYEGTGKTMFGCWPFIYGRTPDWATWEWIWRCGITLMHKQQTMLIGKNGILFIITQSQWWI